MLNPFDPALPPASLRLADDLAAANSISDLERLRQQFLAKADLQAEERKLLEEVFARRERDLIEYYGCRL